VEHRRRIPGVLLRDGGGDRSQTGGRAAHNPEDTRGAGLHVQVVVGAGRVVERLGAADVDLEVAVTDPSEQIIGPPQ